MDIELEQSKGMGFKQRLSWLVAFRFAIAAALFAATLTIRPGEEEGFLGSSFYAVLFITLLHLIVSAIIVLINRHISGRFAWKFAFGQLFWDVIFTTLLVYITGGIDSFFKLMYWLTILNAGFLLFKTGAFAIAALSGIFYSTLANLMYLKRIPVVFNILEVSGDWQEDKVIASIILNSTGFFIAAYVSSYVASLYREAETKLAKKSLEVEDLEVLMGRIVESLTSGLVTLDPQGRISFWNHTAERITGIKSEEVRTQPFIEMFPNSEPHLEKKMGDGKKNFTPWRWETVFKTRKGEQKILGFSVTDLHHSGEKGEGKLIMFQDLTAYREMEEKVKQADQLAAVGEIAARMAHEIRNPLTSVSGAIEVLQKNAGLDSQDKRLMNIVVRETERLNQLLTDFLIYAKPSTPKFEEVEVDQLLQETSELFSKSYKDPKIKFILDIEPHVCVFGDPKQLSQMIWNLVKNASESMYDKGGEISASAHKDPSRGGVVVEIQDQGPGIPKETQAKIFQPFFTTKSRGTGLGLALVQRIAEDHGGVISVERGNSGGTKFSIHFPSGMKEVNI